MTRYRFGEEKPDTKTTDDSKTPEWLKALLALLDSQRFGVLATLIEVLLWGAVMAGVGLLIWRYRDWLQAFVSRRPSLKRKSPN